VPAKPRHLWPDYAAWFKDPGIVAAYHYRPSYPPEVFAILESFVVDTPRRVLDVACGTGDIARPLSTLVEHVDAVDWSLGMIEKGKGLPGGNQPGITWIHRPVEEAPLTPPYALITAGESIHWLDWDVVLPRFAAALSPNGVLAMIERDWDGPARLRARLGPIFAHYSANRDYRPFDLIGELERRGFRKLGERRSRPVPWRPSLDEYVEMRHSQNGFSRERMGQPRAAAFDRVLRATVEEMCREGAVSVHDGTLALHVEATIIWGRPFPTPSG
jgi:SAM-dependent methyltransferase